MLKDPPKKGDTRYKMYTTKGADWVAWQDVWLEGLQSLKNRKVFVVARSNEFKNKFQKATDDEANKKNCFDARYELSDGERANCILDWERRHVAICAETNKLSIYFIRGGSQCIIMPKPDWLGDRSWKVHMAVRN